MSDGSAGNPDASDCDDWFDNPEGRAWLAANEVKARRQFAATQSDGDKSGDPQFDEFLGKVLGQK